MWAIITLPINLTCVACPRAPTWIDLLLTAASSGCRPSKTSRGPPHISNKVPACAAFFEPVIGDSSSAAPRAAIAVPRRRIKAGYSVEKSTTRVPAASPSTKPCAPKAISSIAGGSAMQVHSASRPGVAASARGEAAQVAPAASSGSARERLRLCTTS